MHAISSAALRKLPDFNAQELANTAWSVATLGLWTEEPLLHAISSSALRRYFAAPWQPFFDCFDVCSLDRRVKDMTRCLVSEFVEEAGLSGTRWT